MKNIFKTLITSILLLIVISPSLNSQVDEDCLCLIRKASSGDVFVDTCGVDRSCDEYSLPYYFNAFKFNNFNNYGLSDSDTGEVSLSKFLNSSNDYSDSFKKLDEKFNVKKIERYVLEFDQSNFYSIFINNKSEEDTINNFMIENFQEYDSYFTNVLTQLNIEETKDERIFITTTSNGDIIVENIFDKSEIRIIDYLGLELYRKKPKVNNNSNAHVIRDLQKGFYFVIIDGILYEKIFISN